MERRQFITATATGFGAMAALGGAALAAQGTGTTGQPQPATAPAGGVNGGGMKLACQSGPSTDEHFAYFARYGVTHIAATTQIADGRLYPTVEELSRTREMAERHGLVMEIYTPPLLPSSHTDRERNPAIMRADSPQRDRDIEAFNTTLQNCAAAGIPCVKYNMSILGVLRTEREPGRGDSTYSSWRLAKALERGRSSDDRMAGSADSHAGSAAPVDQLTQAGPVDNAAFWERITYFLDRVVPVANETRTRIACHPHDPGVPPTGYQGVDRVLGTVDGLRHFLSINASPYHGLNFCQGTVSEMLTDPGTQIYDVIREFAQSGKIFNVHFRNIAGHRDSFTETFPDNGDVDMVRALRAYQEGGYTGMLMPDHVPQAEADPRGLQSFAFAYGYIRGLLQSLDRAA